MKRENSIPSKIRILSAVIFWILFLSVDILKKNILTIEDTSYLVSYYLFGFFLWFCLTFPLFYLFQLSQKFSVLFRIIFLTLLGPITGSIKVILSWTSFFLTIGLHERDVNLISFIMKQGSFPFVEASIIAWVVLILFFLSELYLKYRDKSTEASMLKSQLIQARLETLKMQLQPHFLFNAHNTISMLIRTKKYDQAVDMTSQLSELLRATLNPDEKNFIRLDDEVTFARKFLAIESIRFEDILNVEIDIDPESTELMVPNLILQPVIENAFKHGISKHLGKSILRLKAKKVGEKVLISIFNTGPQLPSHFTFKNNRGVGLNNVVSRLNQSYQGNYIFSLSNRKDGVICEIEIPYNGKN